DWSAGEEAPAAMARAGDGGLNAIVAALVSQPSVTAALAEQLTDEQLQDYMDSFHARQRRDRRAVNRHVAAWADHQFSMTADQRAKLEQLLDGHTVDEGRVSARRMVWDSSGQWLLRDALDAVGGSADELLSEAQLGLWWALLPPVLAAYKKIMAMVGAGEMTREQATQRLNAVSSQAKNNDGVGDLDAVRRLAAARLAAHTEQLGELEAPAAQRLALVSKGVVEQHLEGLYSDADERVRAAEARMAEGGRMTRRELGLRLLGLREQILGEQFAATSDVTEHPLYQQTIKDPLSAEAVAHYEERQAQRSATRQQASRDLAVACMDSHLILADGQRQRVEATAAELPVPSETDGTPAAPFVLYDLAQGMDRELLSPWQQEQLQAMGRELGFDRIEWMRNGGGR
ncbi:MAG: hypothetical protein ABGY41_21005, partial [Candidatus Poribacteria bacterium]